MYLLDTDVLIENLRHGTAFDVFFLHETTTISFTTLVELVQGCKTKRELEQLQEYVTIFTIDYGNAEINELGCNLFQEWRSRKGLSFVDAIIAATAIKRELTLVTRNYKHFNFLPDLNVIQPF